MVPDDFSSCDILTPWRGHLVRQRRTIALLMMALTISNFTDLDDFTGLDDCAHDLAIAVVMAQSIARGVAIALLSLTARGLEV